MSIPISRVKLRPPRLPQGHISRAHLLQKIEDGQAKKVTLIIAGAGYGKSTLLAEWVQSKAASVWYSLDAPDRDPAVFFAYILAGLQEKRPELGRDTQAILNRPVAPDPESLTISLLGEIEAISAVPGGERPLLVFDDYHRLGDAPGIHAAMKIFLERLPPPIHVAISSRTPLEFTARLGADGQVNKLTTHDLRFSDNEILQILDGSDTSSSAVQHFLRQTEGWAAGLQLLRQALEQPRTFDLKTSPGMANDPLADAYAYLAEELFMQQPLELQQFLLQTAILDTFSPDDCNAIFERNDSAHWLSYLTRQNLFTIHLQRNPDMYRYHHLLSDYLRRKLRREGESEEIRDWHRRSATYYHNKQQWIEAFEHAMEAETESIAVDIVTQSFSSMRLSGRLDTVQEWLEQFSPDTNNLHPHLHSFQGIIWMEHSHYDQARAAFEKALAIAEAQRDRRGLLSAWSGIGWLRQRMGDLESALQAWNQAFDQAKLGGLLLDQLTTLNGLATVYSLLGQNQQTCELLHQGLEKAAHLGKPYEALIMGNLATALTNLGEFGEALRWYENSIALRQEAELRPGLAHSFNNTGRVLWFMGNLTAAHSMLLQAQALSQEINDRGLLSYVLSNLGDVASSEGNLEQAETYYRQSIQLKESLQDPFGLLHTWTRLSELYRQSRHLDEAVDYAQRAIKLSEKGIGLNERLAAQTALVLTRLLDEEYSESAIGQLAEIISIHQDVTSNKYELTRCLWFLAVAKHHSGQDCLKPLAEALSLAERWYYRFLLFTLARESPDLLAEAIAADLQPALVTDLLKELGETAASPLIQLLESPKAEIQIRAIQYLAALGVNGAWEPLAKMARSNSIPVSVRDEAQKALQTLQRTPPAPLYVTTLGEFTLRRGDQPIPDSAWINRKAQTLFKYLLQRVGTSVHREELLDWLWPEAQSDEEMRKARKNLNQLVSRLRQVLEPYLPRYFPSRYLAVEVDMYRLDLPEGSRVDAQLFEKAVTEAERSRRVGDKEAMLAHYQTAATLYQGDYLTEHQYEDWCISYRERLRPQAVQVFYELAHVYLIRHEWETAVSYARRWLMLEPGDEKGYAMLIQALIRLNRLTEARRACDECKEQLKELGLTPSSVLDQLCDQIRA